MASVLSLYSLARASAEFASAHVLNTVSVWIYTLIKFTSVSVSVERISCQPA